MDFRCLCFNCDIHYVLLPLVAGVLHVAMAYRFNMLHPIALRCWRFGCDICIWHVILNWLQMLMVKLWHITYELQMSFMYLICYFVLTSDAGILAVTSQQKSLETVMLKNLSQLTPKGLQNIKSAHLTTLNLKGCSLMNSKGRWSLIHTCTYYQRWFIKLHVWTVFRIRFLRWCSDEELRWSLGEINNEIWLNGS